MGFTEEMKKALKGSGANSLTGFPAFATIDSWCAISGLGRRVTYDELGRGNLKAIKVGARTLIDVPHGLAWLRSRPAAVIRAPKQRNANRVAI
jgi:hypothetical protein